MGGDGTLLTIGEVAGLLRVSPSTVKRLLVAGAISSVIVGAGTRRRSRRVRRADLDSFIARGAVQSTLPAPAKRSTYKAKILT